MSRATPLGREGIPSPADLALHRVLVVGDAMLDRYWMGDVDRISPEAPVPVVRIMREEDRLGGAANVALNIQTLGAACTLLTVVGEDDAGRRLRELLQAQGIEVISGTDPTLQTIVKLRVIGRAQQLLRIDFESQPDHEVLELMLGEFDRTLPRSEVVLFSDYGKGGLTHIPRMIQAARSSGKTVLVDPKGFDYERYSGVDVITPNRSELSKVIGPWSSEAELEVKAQHLRERLQIGALLLTRSEEGMSLFDAEGHLRVHAQAREVFDVTGAGDTVIACLASLLASRMPLRSAVGHANRAGGIAVGKFGTSTVSWPELFA